MRSFQMPLSRVFVRLDGFASAVTSFAFDKPFDWPARWRRVYAPVFPLGFVARMTLRMLLLTFLMVPFAICMALRDHAAGLRAGRRIDD